MGTPLTTLDNVPQKIHIRFDDENQPDIVAIDGHVIHNIIKAEIETSGNLEFALISLQIGVALDRINFEAAQIK